MQLGRPRFGILAPNAREPSDLDPREGPIPKKAVGEAAAKLELPAEVWEGEKVGLHERNSRRCKTSPSIRVRTLSGAVNVARASILETWVVLANAFY